MNLKRWTTFKVVKGGQKFRVLVGANWLRSHWSDVLYEKRGDEVYEVGGSPDSIDTSSWPQFLAVKIEAS